MPVAPPMQSITVVTHVYIQTEHAMLGVGRTNHWPWFSVRGATNMRHVSRRKQGVVIFTLQVDQRESSSRFSAEFSPRANSLHCGIIMALWIPLKVWSTPHSQYMVTWLQIIAIIHQANAITTHHLNVSAQVNCRQGCDEVDNTGMETMVCPNVH